MLKAEIGTHSDRGTGVDISKTQSSRLIVYPHEDNDTTGVVYLPSENRLGEAALDKRAATGSYISCTLRTRHHTGMIE